MKNHLFKTGTILLIMVMSWSCTKETVQNASEKFPELKAFYNSHRPDDQNIFKNTQPLWKKVNKLSQSNFIVYEVEMLNPDKVGITSKRLTTKDIKNYWDTHTLKMLFFVDPIKNIIVKGCYMAVEATSAIDLEKVHYKQTNGLTGQVVYYNLDGTLSNGVNYANGIPVREILELSIEEVVKVKKQNNISLLNERLVVVQGCSVQYIETGYIGCVGAGDYENCKWYSTGYSSYMVCEGVQEKSVLEDYGGGGGGGGNSNSPTAEDPGDTYEVETLTDSISLKKKLDCFKGVPDNANTIYTARIYADLPNDANPNALIGPDRVGHAFVTLIKTNGSNSITQTFGFYPEKGIKSVSGLYVNSQIEDDGATQHQFNASYSLNFNKLDFERMISAAKTYSELKYNLNNFNCTDYALAVFNAGLDNNNQLVVHDWIFGFVTPTNYGTTPTGLYKKIKEMKDTGKTGAATNTGNAPSSSNCN